jgi:hypothetical protein
MHKNLMNLSKSKKVHISVTFLLLPFCAYFTRDLKSTENFPFLRPFLIFRIIIFGYLFIKTKKTFKAGVVLKHRIICTVLRQNVASHNVYVT